MTDPVCGMTVDPRGTLGAGYQGRIYHFCSEGCRTQFLAHPQKYVAQKTERHSAPAVSKSPGENNERSKSPTSESALSAPGADRGAAWTDYLPLMILVGLSVAVACAKQIAYPGPTDMRAAMHDFMGIFLVIFSMFKFFDLSGFADGFQMYDLLAKPFRPYAYVYPFLELLLGLGYLSAWNLPVVYGATIALMTFGALGVLRALKKGLNLNCACMGTVLKVPLSTVALTEDLGMTAMATVMWSLSG